MKFPDFYLTFCYFQTYEQQVKISDDIESKWDEKEKY